MVGVDGVGFGRTDGFAVEEPLVADLVVIVEVAGAAGAEQHPEGSLPGRLPEHRQVAGLGGEEGPAGGLGHRSRIRDVGTGEGRPVAGVILDLHEPGIVVVGAVHGAVLQHVHNPVLPKGHVDGAPEVAVGGHEGLTAHVVLVFVEPKGDYPIPHPVEHKQGPVIVRREFAAGGGIFVKRVKLPGHSTPASLTQLRKHL